MEKRSDKLEMSFWCLQIDQKKQRNFCPTPCQYSCLENVGWFVTLKKSGPYFFKVPDPKKISGQPEKLE